MSTPGHRTVPGASYFVTTKCWEGRSLFQVTEVAEIMLNTLFHYRDSGAYLLHSFVIMPDHLHLLLTPGPETSLEKAMQLIKGRSSHRIHKERGGKMEIWQVGFHDWTIRDLDDWKAKAKYIQMNPVKARLCERVEDWVYSSANQKFCLDGMPEKYRNLASGAKAQFVGTVAQGLKPLPPKETAKVGAKAPTRGGCTEGSIPQGLKPTFVGSSNVGPKGPTPGACTEKSIPSGAKAQVAGGLLQGLKPLPPKEAANVGAKAPTPGACTERSIPQGLKPVRSHGGDVGPEGPTPCAPTKNPDTAVAHPKEGNS